MHDRDLFAGGALVLGAATLARGLLLVDGVYGLLLAIAGGVALLGVGAYGLRRSGEPHGDFPRPLVGLYLLGVALYVAGFALDVVA